jgi:cysteine desulfurase
MRSGTLNVPGIIGMGKALEIAGKEMKAEVERYRIWTKQIFEQLRAELGEENVVLNGHPTERLPHNLHICFSGVEGESLVDALDRVGIECSAGAACTSATWEPSHVLLAMGVPLDLAIGSLRMSLWPTLTVPQIDYVAAQVPAVVERLRAAASAAS